MDTHSARGPHHKKNIYDDVEVEAGKHVARVTIVPQKDLHWGNHGCVEEQRAAGKEQYCKSNTHTPLTIR